MGYSCIIKVIDKESYEQLGLQGKVVERFFLPLNRSYEVGERITTVEHGKHKVFEVVEEVSLTVKQILKE